MVLERYVKHFSFVLFSIGCSTILNISDIEKKNERIVKLLVTH